MVQITNREIYSELRLVHSKLEILTEKISGYDVRDKILEQRVNGLENIVRDIDRRIYWSMGAVAVLSFCIPLIIRVFFQE